ncbi:MAG TPA: cyclic nucleotide-binding domain-containing protein [Kofleriaceae bacterium]|nr:cyclic nucleotide-binding domain-containing protein [Kofleriaceae bacterium]
MATRDPHQLREEAATAVARGKLDIALALYGELEQLEPTAAAWPKRVGETYRRIGDSANAVLAFERAVDKYARDGLLVQAIAVCKLILQLEPTHASTAERLAELATPPPTEARAIRAQTIAPAASMARQAPADMARRAAAIGEDKPVPRAAAQPRREEAPATRAELLAPRTVSRNVIPRVALPPGAALDAIPLAMVMPDSLRIKRDDGSDAGMSVLRVDVALDDFDDVEIEVVDPHRLALLRTPVFAELPAATLEQLIARLELRDLYNGEVVFREGDAGASMFVISEGEVEVETAGQDLATLGPGAFFGEIALVTDLPRSATVRAKGRVELLALDREVVRGAAERSPEIVTALLHFVRDRLVDRVARTSPLFRPFSDDERALLASRFEVVEVDAGTRLITFGQRADGLYVMLAGKVDVTRTGEGSLATLASGDVFGEMSLMGNRGSTADVLAKTRVLALRLPAAVFQEIIVTYPQVLEYLGDLTSSRSRLSRAEEFLDLHITLV